MPRAILLVMDSVGVGGAIDSDKYFNGSDGFTKDFDLAARWYRKAEKKIKDVKSMDLDNEAEYQRQLELIRYKRDIAEQN